MSFKVLEKQDATIDEMAAAYVNIEQQKAELQANAEAAYGEMVGFQQQLMSGKKGSSQKLDQAKDRHKDLELQTAACSDALGKLRQRIINEMPKNMERKRAELEKAHEKAMNERGQLKRQWLRLCAEAAILNERLQGQNFLHTNTGESPSTPTPGFKFAALSNADQDIYLKEVQKARDKADLGASVTVELQQISNQLDRIDRTLSRGDFITEAEKLIQSYRPEAPAEAEPEKESNQNAFATPVERDYDALYQEY